MLWTKCPCGAPSLTSPAPSQLSGFPQTQYCNLFCFFPSSPTTPLRNQLAKKQKNHLCLLASSKPALGCCDVMPPNPSSIPLALVASPHRIPCLFLAAASPLDSVSWVGVGRGISKTRCLEHYSSAGLGQLCGPWHVPAALGWCVAGLTANTCSVGALPGAMRARDSFS